MIEPTNEWNIQRVIKEYTKIASVFSVDIPFKEIAYPKQIKLRRIASVLNAFLNDKGKLQDVMDIIDFVFGHVDNHKLFEESKLNSENVELIYTLLDTNLISSHIKANLKNMPLDARNRKSLFDMLMRYRTEAEYLKTTFSTTIEADFARCLAINLCASIYNNPLSQCNERLEQILVLLLGERFIGSFNEDELKDNFDFPLTTDEELLDWTIDNM